MGDVGELQKMTVSYDTTTYAIIDIMQQRDGVLVSQIGSKTLAQLQQEYPECQLALGDFDEVLAQRETHLCTDPVEITRDKFIEMLEVLPPVNWRRVGDTESFQFSERFSGRVTGTYARVGERYFSFYGLMGMPYIDIMAKLKASLSDLPIVALKEDLEKFSKPATPRG